MMRMMELEARVAGGLVIAGCVACSSNTSSSVTTREPFDGGSSQPTKDPPTGAADAPVLQDFETGTPETVPPGNTPIQHGVRCEPASDDALNIVYACTVFVSKTQKATETGGYTCSALDVKVLGTPSFSQPIVPIAAPKPGTNFGLSLPKQIFPTLSQVSLTADCSTPGHSIEIGRPYHLVPL
jgi:hypothetical protein